MPNESFQLRSFLICFPFLCVLSNITKNFLTSYTKVDKVFPFCSHCTYLNFLLVFPVFLFLRLGLYCIQVSFKKDIYYIFPFLYCSQNLEIKNIMNKSNKKNCIFYFNNHKLVDFLQFLLLLLLFLQSHYS